MIRRKRLVLKRPGVTGQTKDGRETEMEAPPAQQDDMPHLHAIASETLEAFAAISNAASAGLADRGISLGSFASVNEATADKLAGQLRERNEERVSDYHKLRHEPAIARIVIADEDDQREVLYISSSGRVDTGAVKLCSYMSPKGRLASFSPGDGTEIGLPGGSQRFDVIEKLTFKALDCGGEWDARPAIQFLEDKPPRNVRSLRELLRDDGVPEEAIDAVAQWLADDADAEADNVTEGLRRETLTAIDLRIAPILDRFQDRIFRMPIDSRIAVMGPPGTGKTTTLVRRLRQKLDLAYLDADETALLERAIADGADHATSWIMFTPTELLRLYVKEAFGKEDVPVHDARLWTWRAYRRKIARDTLRILKTGTGSGFILPENFDDGSLAAGTLTDQTRWYEAFDAFQRGEFASQMLRFAETLAGSSNARASALGSRATKSVATARGDPMQLIVALANMRADLTAFSASLAGPVKKVLDAPLTEFANRDSGFLDALSALVTAMLQEQAERSGDSDDDDPDGPDDEDENGAGTRTLPTGRQLVAETFRRAMRTLATSRANGRSPAPGSRAGRIVALVEGRGLILPDLKPVGRDILLSRAAGRLANAANLYIGQIPARYRRFRRDMRGIGRWYSDESAAAGVVHGAEIDLVILAMLRAAQVMERSAALKQRLDARRPEMLDAIAGLRRHQVLVDEATDFSPVQLACMAALADPGIASVFYSGDFDQRLTRSGARHAKDLEWAAPGLTIEPISVAYRQSGKLTHFARQLLGAKRLPGGEAAPDNSENIGVDPVAGTGLAERNELAGWLADRIGEIEAFVQGPLPTIAVLVCDEAALDPLTDALNTKLQTSNIRALACKDGKVMGQSGDVRVFSVEHIKGLEFEAVFFADVDRLQDLHPDIFERYIYVGATRAATFLGLTCTGGTLPPALQLPDVSYRRNW